MRSADRQPDPLDLDLFVQSQSELRTLKSRLPSKDVEDLAREVIRRLADRHPVRHDDTPSADRIEQLAHALLSPDDRAGARFVADLREGGASVETVYLKYLAEAARLLGHWWDEDRIPFTEVALGTVRIFAILQQLRHAFPNARAVERSAVFTSVPGETHTLGVRMAADLFRRDGWKIDLKVGQPHEKLVGEIAATGAHLIGISVGGLHSLSALSRLIVALRISNPHAWIFVGGHVCGETAEAVSKLGVDGMASDLETAKEVMTGLWKQAQAAENAPPEA